MRFITALRAFFKILFDGSFAGEVEKLLRGAPARKAEPEPLPSEAAQLLALFQRDGRFVDFLMEEIDGFPNDQVGAMAKQLQKGCRKVLDDYIRVVPVRKEDESAVVTVEKGFDPSAERLTGIVAGDPPFTGALRHHGWKAESIKLPKLSKGADPSIVAPAEIEIS